MPYSVIKTAATIFVVFLVVSGCQTIDQRLEVRMQNSEFSQEQNVDVTVDDNNDVVVEKENTTTTQYGIQKTAYKLFFSNPNKDPNLLNCGAVYWLSVIDEKSTDNVLSRSIELLLSGVPGKWQDLGYMTSLPKEVKINSFKVEGDVAYIDFDEGLNKIAGSCAVQAARSQLENTIKYNAQEVLGINIAQVVISVNGDAQTALQP